MHYRAMPSRLSIIFQKIRERRRVREMSREQFEQFKLEKFRHLVAHASKHAPYYEKIIAEREIAVESCVPADFPELSKAQLMRHFDDIVTVPNITKRDVTDFLSRSADPAELLLGKYRVVHTSGSSGEVGYFLFSRADWMRALSLHGRRHPRKSQGPKKRRGLRRIRLAFYGATGGHFAGISTVSAIRKSLLRYIFDIATFEVNDPLPQTIAELNAFQPDMLIGYTTALKMLAEKQRAGALHLSLTSLASSGEAQSAADRKFLESVFDCEVMNLYASSEHLTMGVALPDGDRMVLYDDELIFEFHDDHTLVTNLFNYTMPLIRYRMSDVLRVIPDDLSHVPYLIVDSLVGRSEISPAFENADGEVDFLSPHTINEIYVAGVRRFQMRLVGPTKFRFLICLERQLRPEQREAAVADTKQRLLEILDQKHMSNVDFEITVVDDLPVNRRTRKFQMIVDERTPDGH